MCHVPLNSCDQVATEVPELVNIVATMGTYNLHTILFLHSQTRSTATTNNHRPARLLVRRLERCPNAALWGFPVDLKLILAKFNETVPPNASTDRDKHTHRLLEYSSKVFSALESQTLEIWPEGSATVSPRHVFAKRGHTGEKTIIAIVRSTRPDDKFIPPLEKVENLKAIFAEQGFDEEPGWFMATN